MDGTYNLRTVFSSLSTIAVAMIRFTGHDSYLSRRAARHPGVRLYVAPSAVLCGVVTLGERVHVLHGAVLTAEDGEIWTGDDVVIMENALVRGRSRHPVSYTKPKPY